MYQVSSEIVGHQTLAMYFSGNYFFATVTGKKKNKGKKTILQTIILPYIPFSYLTAFSGGKFPLHPPPQAPHTEIFEGKDK